MHRYADVKQMCWKLLVGRIWIHKLKTMWKIGIFHLVKFTLTLVSAGIFSISEARKQKKWTVSLLRSLDCLLWMLNGRSQACLPHSSSSSSSTAHCLVQLSTCWHFPPLKTTSQGFPIFSTESAMTSDPITSLKGQRVNNSRRLTWSGWGWGVGGVSFLPYIRTHSDSFYTASDLI